jgi:hypothetical protein
MSNQSLSEFTPGNEGSAGPEHQSKHGVTEWLKEHGAGVLWEESNPWNHSTFNIQREGTGGIPDMIVLINGSTFVVEYKTGSSVGQVYDSLTQLVGYWQEYVESDMTYTAGMTELKIDGFLTASSHSPTGRLFPRYAEKRQDHLDMDETRQKCYKWGQLPPAEYRMTEQHIRCLWRMVKQIGGESATNPDTPHIGSLLSDVLEEPSTEPTPAVLWNQSRHNQSWEVLAE